MIGPISVAGRRVLSSSILIWILLLLFCRSSHGGRRILQQQQQEQQQQAYDADEKNTTNNNQRQQQQQPLVLSSSSSQDGCPSLCQELPLRNDTEVPLLTNNFSNDDDENITTTIPTTTTCSNIDFFYRYNFSSSTETAAAAAAAAAASSSCQADIGYNYYFESCCAPSRPIYECEQNIHTIIIDENPLYNTAVPPITSYHDNPLVVTVKFDYQALEAVEVGDGTATIFSTLRLTWLDPRLAWSITETTCANTITVFTGHDVETTQIWVPDFDLVNQIEGVQAMPASTATVYSDGTVVWQRSGGIQAFCSFTGLATIPFDTMGCQFLFAPANPRTNIRYILENPDMIVFGPFDVTYNEWRPVPELAQQGYTFYGKRNMIYYNLFFQRARGYYVQNIVLPTIILTYLSFCTFLLDLRIGERVGFGVALLLVIIAQQIVSSGLTPVSDQRLWLDKFICWSFYWVVFVVVQSVLIGFIYFIRDDRASKYRLKIRSSITDDNDAVLRDDTIEVTNGAGFGHYPSPPSDQEVDDTEGLLEGDIIGNGPKHDEENRIALKDTLHQKDANEINPLISYNEGKKGCWANCLHSFSFRKMDIISLCLAITTYTIFVTGMFSSILSDAAWLTNEPKWMNETSEFSQTLYNTSDPNSR